MGQASFKNLDYILQIIVGVATYQHIVNTENNLLIPFYSSHLCYLILKINVSLCKGNCLQKTCKQHTTYDVSRCPTPKTYAHCMCFQYSSSKEEHGQTNSTHNYAKTAS